MKMSDADKLRALLNAPRASVQSTPPKLQPVYATWAPIYRRLGYHPVPITPGTKACHVRDWQESLTDAVFETMLTRYPDHGIGLVMGSVFADGTRLAALDVDKDVYTPLAMALTQNPTCVRVGSRGVGIFVRLRGDIGNIEFRTKSAEIRAGIKHSEILAVRKICVIPPTLHPDTGQPYRWTGPALHDISFNELPIIEV